MSADLQKMQSEWKKSSSDAKLPVILSAVTLIAVFCPWMSSPKMDFGGVAMDIGVSLNGFHSVGMLTFLGALGYLLWKLLPMAGVKVADFKDPAMVTKVLGCAMLAGPVLWLVQGGFHFQYIGFGLWIALIASAIFVYKAFTQ